MQVCAGVPRLEGAEPHSLNSTLNMLCRQDLRVQFQQEREGLLDDYRTLTRQVGGQVWMLLLSPDPASPRCSSPAHYIRRGNSGPRATHEPTLYNAPQVKLKNLIIACFIPPPYQEVRP